MSLIEQLIASIEEFWPIRYEFPHNEIMDKLADALTYRLPPEADEDYAHINGIQWDENAYNAARDSLINVVEPYLPPNFFRRDNAVEWFFRWNELYDELYGSA